MLSDSGQAGGGMIKTIFVGIILAVVLGMATSMVIANLPATTDYSTTLNGPGEENLNVGSYTSVENGTLTVDYETDGASINLSENLNGNVVIDQSITGTSTIENNVTDYITEDVNTLNASVDSPDNLISLSSTVDTTVKEDTLGVISTAKSMGPTIVTFIFLGLMVLAIVGLIRYFRAI